jgi:two-component system response regulator YesN
MNYAVERIVLGLLNGNITLKDVKDFGMDMHLWESSHYMVVVLEMDDYKEMIENFTDEYLYEMQCFILNAFNEFYSIGKINFLKSVSTLTHQCACLLAFDLVNGEERLLLDQVFSVCDRIRKNVSKEYGVSITIGFSMLGKSAGEIYGLYRQADNAVKHRILQGKNCVQYYGQMNFGEKTAFVYPIKLEEDIIKSLFSLDRRKVSDAINAFIDYVKDCKVLEHNRVYYIFAQLLGSVIKAAYELGGSPLEIWESVDIYQKLSGCGYLSEIKELLVFVADNYIKYLEEKMSNRYKTIVQSAIDYMEANYRDDQLSLLLISEKVYLSPSHFQKIFKDITGKPVMDYLNSIRMEKAKILLKDVNLKIETIAEKVGYQTSKGFIKAFKKYENITPGQYRQNMLSNKKTKRTGVDIK